MDIPLRGKSAQDDNVWLRSRENDEDSAEAAHQASHTSKVQLLEIEEVETHSFLAWQFVSVSGHPRNIQRRADVLWPLVTG